MTQKEIQVGKTYEIKHHDGRLYAVKVLSLKPMEYRNYGYGEDRTMTHYRCLKLATGKIIEVKSAAKFRRELPAENAPIVALECAHGRIERLS
jgi:hypothetical protein